MRRLRDNVAMQSIKFALNIGGSLLSAIYIMQAIMNPSLEVLWAVFVFFGTASIAKLFSASSIRLFMILTIIWFLILMLINLA